MKTYFYKITGIIFLLLLPVLMFSQDRTRLNELFLKLDTVTSGTYYEAAIYQNMGIQYVYINLDSSEYYTKIAIEKFEEQDNLTEVVSATINLAIVYYQRAETDSAINVIIKLMPRVVENGDKLTEGRCYNTLGELARSAEYFDKALEYIADAAKAFKEANNEEHYSANLNRLAAIHYELENYELAIAYADSSLVIAERIGKSDFVVINLDIIGASYKNLKKFEKSLIIYEQIIEIFETENEEISTNVLRNIGEVYFEIENYTKSIEYSLYAYNSAVASGKKIFIENSAAILSKAYSKKGNYERAFYYSEISKNTYNEIFNEEKNAQIAELNTKFETEKKEKEIEQQKNELIVNELDLKKKQIINYTLE